MNDVSENSFQWPILSPVAFTDKYPPATAPGPSDQRTGQSEWRIIQTGVLVPAEAWRHANGWPSVHVAKRSQVRQVFATFVLDLLEVVFVRETRSVPVTSELRCGLRNDTAARERHNSPQHTHPPPAPLYEHSSGSGVGSSSESHDCHRPVDGATRCSRVPSVCVGIFHCLRCATCQIRVASLSDLIC
jgi:hypothetical protein